MEVEKAVQWITLFNEKIQVEKDYLSELDTPIGDGDHGGNMARGMLAVMANLEGKNFENASEVFKIVAMQLVSKVGGASGALYGSAFVGIGKAIDTESLADTLQAGLVMIQKRGKAEAGEKTMVDVWLPIIEAIKSASLSEELVDQAVEATKDIQATKGRASYVGERSIGHIDPGAYSSGLLFKALLEVGDVA